MLSIIESTGTIILYIRWFDKNINHFSSNPMVLRSAHFGPGSSLVHLHGVYCNGTETSITQCPHREWGITDCDHHKDVGISCTPGNNCLIKIVPGINVWYKAHFKYMYSDHYGHVDKTNKDY
jgi:hypothetical protein